MMLFSSVSIADFEQVNLAGLAPKDHHYNYKDHDYNWKYHHLKTNSPHSHR